MKIAYFDVTDWEKDQLKTKLPPYKKIFIKEPLSKSTVNKAADVDIISVFVSSNVNKAVLSKLKKLKFIATRSTGFDHIDLPTCKKRKITVSNVPTYGENTVAEHAMALMLAISRRIVESVDRTKQGNFSFEGLRGFDLKGKTLGVLGTGNIGRHVCKYGKAFDMNVIAFDKFPNKAWAKAEGITYVTFDKLLKSSDVISIHVPLLKSTHHMINKKNIKKIKKGAVLINTARGAIVETEAILLGLEKNIFSWVGLDVLEEEKAIKEEHQLLREEFQKECDFKTVFEEHILMEHERAIVTPHNAFNSNEALLRIINTTLDNIKAFSKKKPINLVK